MDRSNDKLVAAFAAVLRDRRERAGLTQEDLAERADVSARFISFLENGRRQPTLSALAALSTGIGANMVDVIGDVEARYRETSASNSVNKSAGRKP
ncbi:MAG: helix-turn-helix transcriptional regulator [Proteobacteria bacterium]|nr:helix-turn-helix transcriptional regulator [Pseudomonadota bacterium]